MTNLERHCATSIGTEMQSHQARSKSRNWTAKETMKTLTIKTLIDKTRGLKFTESPRWRDGKLCFLDIHDKRIKTADLGGRIETAVELAFIPNAFGFRRDGSILVGDAMQRRIYRWDGRELQPLANLAEITVFCLSDGIVDAAGPDVCRRHRLQLLRSQAQARRHLRDRLRRARWPCPGRRQRIELPERDGGHTRWQDIDRR